MSSALNSTGPDGSYHQEGYDAPQLASDPESDKIVYAHPVYQSYVPPSVAPTFSDYKPSPAQSTPPPAQSIPPPAQSKPTPTIFGLARSTFIAFALVAFLVVAGAVGGGVGGSIAAQRANVCVLASPSASSASGSVSSTTTPSSDTSSTAGAALSTTAPSSTTGSLLSVPTTNVALALDCPDLSHSQVGISLGQNSWTFDLTCGKDWKASSGTIDILAATAYTLTDCARACASYNLNMRSNVCIAAEFSAELSTKVVTNYGNCWLKNGTGVPTISTNLRYIGLELVT